MTSTSGDRLRRVVRYGDHAVIADCAGLDEVLGLEAALAADTPAGVIDIVPGARTITLLIDTAALPLEAAANLLSRMPVAGRADTDRSAVALEVRYDGADLAEVARLLGISEQEVVRLHTEAEWRVAFTGFAPGFGYLVCGDERLGVPRRSTPRTTVPAGSVGLAGEFSGVYPRAGSGGWQLIGRTDAVLWDETRDPPALLTPGTRVRFREAGGQGGGPTDSEPDADRPETKAEGAPSAPAAGAPAAHSPTGGEVAVLRPGILALIEDRGRTGVARFGAGRSGALDRAALALGNRLVGNPADAAGLELLLGGAAVRFDTATWFAVTGAGGELTLHGRPVEPDRAEHAAVGSVLEFGPPNRGVRYYLAVRGGIPGREVLGSRSRDVGAGLGPEPLAAGDRLQLGSEPPEQVPAADALTVAAPAEGDITVRVRPGPRERWFDEDAVTRFYETAWLVGAEANRVGLRLTGARLARAERSAGRELPSEAMLPGAIQVPPSGEPVVLLADHPVTGGYPVVAVVVDADLDLFAQLRPGQVVRFRHAR